MYKRAGFVVRTILMDGEFEKIRPLLPNLECNTTAAKEHISEAEQMIRMIKERTRGLLAATVLPHAAANEDRVCIFYCAVDECVPN